MGVKLKNILFKILGLYPAGRACPIRKDDVIIASYPKSGNTWVRFLAGNLLHPGEVSFENIENIIPDIYQHSLYFFVFMKSPRILKSHEVYDRRYKRSIYIVRDPRDVAVSYWHHKVKFRDFGEDYPIKDFTDEFIQSRNIPFGSWADNVGSWLKAQENNPDILLLRYEDLIISPEKEVRKIINHLGLQNTTDKIIKDAISNASFDNMKRLEEGQQKLWEPIKNTRQDMPFVRKGQEGIWKTELPAESALKIEEAWSLLMSRFGYV